MSIMKPTVVIKPKIINKIQERTDSSDSIKVNIAIRNRLIPIPKVYNPILPVVIRNVR